MHALNASGVLAECASALGATSEPTLTDVLKPALRRAAYLLAPCSAVDLLRFVVEPLSLDQADRELAEDVLEDLIAYGDILEMRKIESDPWDVPPIVLRPAPPTFVMRSSGEAIIIGVSADLPSPLPAELTSQLHNEGPVRVLRSEEGELAEYLSELGLSQLSEHAWLRTPPITTAQDHVAGWAARLKAIASSPVQIDGLELIDSEASTAYYRGRWRAPTSKDSGNFVARRPQAYGAKLWCLVELKQGISHRVLDLAAKDGFQRGCDLAWRLQAAVDASRGSAQTVSVSKTSEGAQLDFYAPLPSFAERRLALVAAKSLAQGVLFRFQLPEASLQSEIAALQSTLWMQPAHIGDAP